MSETKANTTREEALDQLIRKEIGSANNRRFLARMPAFKLDADMPDHFNDLLAELDRAENGRSRARS
ncbi:MAG: hypothetical protein KL840_12895 [Aquamicrobium sp.]|jgi:hypothetical protein|nr:hypothetical protein [Aquamicrobium sp.]